MASPDQLVRRSPRLSSASSPSPSLAITTFQGANSSTSSEPLTQSLHASAYVEDSIPAVPLSVSHPSASSSPHDNCLRRTSRSTNNRYSSAFNQFKVLPISCSPGARPEKHSRSDAAGKQSNLIHNSDEIPSSTTKKGQLDSTLVGKKGSRSWAVPPAPAFSGLEEINTSSDAKVKENRCISGPMKLESTEDGDLDEGSAMALPEPLFGLNKHIVLNEVDEAEGKKRSGNIEKEPTINNPNNGNNDNSNCSNYYSNNKSDKIATESRPCNLIVEKCLRSRGIKFHVNGTEGLKVRPKAASVEKIEPATLVTSDNPASVGYRKPIRTPYLIGEPVPEVEARQRWAWRYELKGQRSKNQSWILNGDEEEEIILNVDCHYAQAKVDGCIFNIGDCALIMGKGGENYVGKILEFFKTMDGEEYFRVQWFFRADDTIMQQWAFFHDKKRLFISSLMNDNLVDCIISKVNVVELTPKLGLISSSIPKSAFYYDMEYCVEYSTFRNLLTEYSIGKGDSTLCGHIDTTMDASLTFAPSDDLPFHKAPNALALLDLYSGCGGMSTGLCYGARFSGVNIITRWAVDLANSACDSLKLNHPESHVRNEAAEDFLDLLKEWQKLCHSYAFDGSKRKINHASKNMEDVDENMNYQFYDKVPTGEFEVSCLVDVCYGDPNETGKRGLNFKVRWKGYSPSEDTWEPIQGLINCQERIHDFVKSGLRRKILPLPGDVDVLCGGPPCQGISGYNRFRNVHAPLEDERNRQIIVFMDIVKFLKPKYVLMENVVDILRFDKASLARYALSRLVDMRYQVRLGTMAAGCYGLPQFRLRVFLWGAIPSEKLPQFPLPTHDVIVRYWPPSEFERNTVAYDEGQPRDLEDAITLRDAISDLPAVTSHETRESMTYKLPPETEFQKFIRSSKSEMMGFASGEIAEPSSILYDHRPYQLSEDNYLRVCQIPRRKGANFRDLPGVIVGNDNVACRDPTKEPMMLPSGKRLVPDYVFTFEQGKSKRPFARLWWDETVATVLTFPNITNQAALHPEQDRALTLRECARLQGFPDFYRFCGTIKERYCQVGNAVAVPVARALGYALGMAYQKLSGDEPLTTLPPKFSFQHPSNK